MNAKRKSEARKFVRHLDCFEDQTEMMAFRFQRYFPEELGGLDSEAKQGFYTALQVIQNYSDSVKQLIIGEHNGS